VADEAVLEVVEGVQLCGVCSEGCAVLLLRGVELARQSFDGGVFPVAGAIVRLR
jgi:hypothetical protein